MSTPANDSNCMWRGHEKPRTIRNRHLAQCPNPDDCRGCQPCLEPHCLVCGTDHTDGVCPTCLGETRNRLSILWQYCSRLTSELVARPDAPGSGPLQGVPGGVVMFLAGPAADPEAYAHRATTALRRAHAAKPHSPAARSADHLRDEHDADDEPPLQMLTWWEDKWRDLKTDPSPSDTAPRSIGAAINYLESTLRWAAINDPGFKDFHRDLAHQIARVEDALHDGERPDKGAPCLVCGTTQEKQWGETAAADRWICPRCKRVLKPDAYARSTAAEAQSFAEWLNGTAMADQYGVRYGTLRVWANRGDVRKKGRDHGGRILYNVADTTAMIERQTRRTQPDDTNAEVV